jgi:all-trans-8'-apo-beta-carotenal 15,15'-oxygenase
MMISRREFNMMLTGMGTTLMFASCSPKSLPLKSSIFPPLEEQELPYLGLATSLLEEHDYYAEIEGTIPSEIRGTLYRNGPGLFDRGGMRKRALLDGDGMLQLFRFSDNGVRYINKFVRTEKYLEEEAAGRFIHPTLSTVSPEGFFANLGGAGKVKTQAGVNVFLQYGKLYAFDESCVAYAVDPQTLGTLEPTTFGLSKDEAFFSAHPKIDPRTGEWLHFGLQYGPRIHLHINVFDSKGKRQKKKKIRLPRPIYLHDWFVSENYFILNLHPMEISVFPLLLGLSSIADSFNWRPENGNIVLVVERHGDGEPLWIPAPPAFMWHSINAHEQGDKLIADCVCFESPDHFLGDGSPVAMTMRGKQGTFEHPGRIVRHTISLSERKVSKAIYDGAGYEWPFVSIPGRFTDYRYAYLTKSYRGEFFWTGLSRRDMKTGKEDAFDFGEGIYCTEPVFVPVPGLNYEPTTTDEPGWIMSEVYNGHTKKSFLSILRADRIQDGPVANVHLRHHVPYTFHGFWLPDHSA